MARTSPDFADGVLTWSQSLRMVLWTLLPYVLRGGVLAVRVRVSPVARIIVAMDAGIER